MSERPSLGVVIACFNDGGTLADAVGSIREERPVAVVVVDDASTDPATAAALAELEASRADVRVLRHDANRGPAEARTTGLRAIGTDLVFFLDADDLLEPGALGALAALLEADPGADFAFGAVRFFGERDAVRPTPAWSPWRLLYNNFWSVSSLFRRDRLLATGGFDTRSDWEDWDFFLKAATLGLRGVGTERVAFRYRMHPTARRRLTSQARFREQYRLLRRVHADLYRRRRELRRRDRPGRAERLFWPAVGLAYAHLPSAVTGRLIGAKNAVALGAGPTAAVRELLGRPAARPTLPAP